MQAMIADSAKNCIIIEEVFAPNDFRIPISLVRSVTDTNIIIMTPIPPTKREIPATNELSDAMSKDMKKRGFKFTGSTVIYAFLQAVGVINDHADYCFRQVELMD